MTYEDKLIVCEDCGAEFSHTADDQARYAERGFTQDPKRCRPCREKRKAQQQAGGGGQRRPRPSGPRPDRGRGGYGGGGRGGYGGHGGGGHGGGGHGGSRSRRESFEVVCAACGASTTVPFRPAADRPVYCRDCYRAQKAME